MSARTIPIFVSAGDPSGDIAGFHLIEGLKSKCDNVVFFGLGGERMRRAGQQQLIEGNRLAVMGFWEVAKKAIFFRKLMNRAVLTIVREKPRVVVLIDYPGFNLRLARKIGSLKIPIVYYISPQVWAWGAGRIHRIKELVDFMLLILPFEKDLYDRAGIKNEFVGHYLLDDIEESLIKKPYDRDSDLILLMPGSRPQEIERMLPVMLKSAMILSQKGRWRFAVAGVQGNIDYQRYLERAGVKADLIIGDTRKLIARSRLVITSSGTATLETGIIGRPMIVIYKMGFLTHFLARLLIRIDRIGLINITASKRVVPELIQSQATPERISRAALDLLNDKAAAVDMVRQLNEVVSNLGTEGASMRAATAIGEYIGC